MKRSNRGGNDRIRGKDYSRDLRDKSRIRCFTCSAYGHYATECKKPKRDGDVREEAHIAQIPDNEPSLLMVEREKDEKAIMMINEDRVMPKLSQNDTEK